MARLGNQAVESIPADLNVTGTAASGSGVTVSLPLVVGSFHYLADIEIQQYAASAQTGGATPVVVTTTNLGGVTFNFDSALAIGASQRLIKEPTIPIKSAVVGTATTIVCPAVVGVIWNVNVHFYAAP